MAKESETGQYDCDNYDAIIQYWLLTGPSQLRLYEGLMYAVINALWSAGSLITATAKRSPSLDPKGPPMFIATLQILARGGGGGPRFLLPLLLLLLLGGLTGLLIKRRRKGLGGSGSGSALEALRERFARGEIDHAEFEHRHAVLMGADVVPPAPAPSSAAAPIADAEADGPDSPGAEE